MDRNVKREKGAKVHGHTRHNGKSGYSPTYASWVSMRSRCRDPKQGNYKRYGGKGITICSRWDSFSAFLQDMGERPKDTTLDRVDPRGNYEPSNCRWATSKIQNHNKTGGLRWLEHGGKRLILGDWAQFLGIHRTTLTKRFKNGWPVHLALSMTRQGPYAIRHLQVGELK